jgi:uncharacterized SAM-binding protein YcdF (DUF218 family)
MDAQGNLNSESMGRAKLGATTFKLSNAKYMATCGWAYRPDSSICIADAFKLYIVSNFEISSACILAERESRDTVGDAYFTKTKMAIPLGWSSICVVTSEYHVRRTREIFEFIYGPKFTFDVIGAPVASDDAGLIDEENSIVAFRNTFINISSGDNKAILERLIKAHPFYNGVKHRKLEIVVS